MKEKSLVYQKKSHLAYKSVLPRKWSCQGTTHQPALSWCGWEEKGDGNRSLRDAFCASHDCHFLPSRGCLSRPRRNSCQRAQGSFWPRVCNLCPQDSLLCNQLGCFGGSVLAQPQARQCAENAAPSQPLSSGSMQSFFFLIEWDLRNHQFNSHQRGCYWSKFT